MKNKLMKRGNQVIRILDVMDDNVFIIDCLNMKMPIWCRMSEIQGFELCTDNELPGEICDFDDLDSENKKIMHERFTLIAGMLNCYRSQKENKKN